MNKNVIENLINKKLIKVKKSSNYPGFFVIKYTSRVFYDNLWNDELLECRGLVVDRWYNPVIRPFRKIFNYMENGATLPRDEEVYCVNKINGFMAAATRVDDQLIVSTTGSLDSDFVKLAQKYLKEDDILPFINKNQTYLFEICDPADPHIIKEEPGAYLLGSRQVDADHVTWLHTPSELDDLAIKFNCYRPAWDIRRFSDAVSDVKTVSHEGYVVIPVKQYHVHPGIKLKSPYYKTTKFIARMRNERLKGVLNKPHMIKQKLDEEFYSLIDYLAERKEAFIALDEQQRIEVIESFYRRVDF